MRCALWDPRNTHETNWLESRRVEIKRLTGGLSGNKEAKLWTVLCWRWTVRSLHYTQSYRLGLKMFEVYIRLYLYRHQTFDHWVVCSAMFSGSNTGDEVQGKAWPDATWKFHSTASPQNHHQPQDTPKRNCQRFLSQHSLFNENDSSQGRTFWTCLVGWHGLIQRRRFIAGTAIMPDSITAIMPDSFTEGIAMALQNVYMYIYRYTRIYIYITLLAKRSWACI